MCLRSHARVQPLLSLALGLTIRSALANGTPASVIPEKAQEHGDMRSLAAGAALHPPLRLLSGSLGAGSSDRSSSARGHFHPPENNGLCLEIFLVVLIVYGVGGVGVLLELSG